MHEIMTKGWIPKGPSRGGNLVLDQEVPANSCFWRATGTTKKTTHRFLEDVFRGMSPGVPHPERDVSPGFHKNDIFILQVLCIWVVYSRIVHDSISEPCRESGLAPVKYTPFEVWRDPDRYIWGITKHLKIKLRQRHIPTLEPKKERNQSDGNQVLDWRRTTLSLIGADRAFMSMLNLWSTGWLCAR